MSCTNCNPSPASTSGMQLFYPTNCTTQSLNCPTDIANSSYQGPNLPCTGIATGTNMQDVIQTFDTKLCAVLGDYTLYNKYCLDDTTPITNQKQFVEAISSYVCTLRADFTTFTGTTFEAYKQTTVDRFEAIETPGITSGCAAVGIDSDDTLVQSLSKLSSSVCNIYNTHLTLTGVNWGGCFTVSTPPTTLPAAFQLLADQICSIKADVGAGAVLPTFNNTSTCLPSPGAVDTLESTVVKLRTRLCQTPTFDINALTWGCVVKPSTATTDLQGAFNALMAKVDELAKNMPTYYSGDFDVTYLNPSEPCQGKVIHLASSPVADRYVAVNVADTTPGTLVDKLVNGSNVNFDTTTIPGKIIINADGGGVTDGRVKVGATDAAADYLINKVTNATNTFGITPVITEDELNDQLVIGNEVNIELLTSKILEAIANNPTLLAQLCAINRTCPSPCAPPTNVTVTYASGTSTTTSTTTTTAAP